MNPRGFGSDNHAGVHPEILKSLAEANTGHAPSYGTDQETTNCIQKFRDIFQCPQAEVFFVFNGTAANVLSLSQCLEPYHSVLVTEVSHLNMDECGAPEAWGRIKLIPFPHHLGKFAPEDFNEITWRHGDQHFSQVKMISLTQPTELGTCYSLEEFEEICAWAKAKNLMIHVDGARLTNAISYLETDFYQLLTKNKVDVVSFGGTKNGLLVGEALVFLNPELANGFKFLRKQNGQLPSKTRFIAAQFLRFLENDLWKTIANHSHKQALLLAEGLRQLGFAAEYPVQSNAVFVRFPQEMIKRLRKNFFFYVWDEKSFLCRLMTSFDTEKQDIDSFLSDCRKYLGANKDII
jgi:threonine aldolase